MSAGDAAAGRPRDGSADQLRAVEELAARLPDGLAPLARMAMNYRWSWTRGGPQLFARLGEHRWEGCGENPIRMLRDVSPTTLKAAAADTAYTRALAETAAEFDEAVGAGLPGADHRSDVVAFMCAEFGVHPSLPIYAGGLGVLAGDILKQASDDELPMVALGLCYREGYFHQRIDPGGWQHEHWIHTDPLDLPAVAVTDTAGQQVTVTVTVSGRAVRLAVWRVDVGRVPLYLLDADLEANEPFDRWLTARLYVSDRELRLAQYALLGIGGVRALHAMGIEAALLHLNEGHAALAPLELARREVAGGAGFDDAIASARSRTVFTTHTPVPAGNESYPPEQVLDVLTGLPEALGISGSQLLDLGRLHPGHHGGEFGMTVLGLRVSRTANGVSRRHGEVAREMWDSVAPISGGTQTPIDAVTNGVHLPSWIAAPMRRLLDRHLGRDWLAHAHDPDLWAGIEAIPDEELWAVRVELRRQLVEFVRERSVLDRLRRGEPRGYVEAARHGLSPDALTIGFARRVATYKRAALLVFDPERAVRLLNGPLPLQVFLAGKAHPADVEAKEVVHQLFFSLKGESRIGERVAYLEDYDIAVARRLVSGCDLWVNLPRPPLEASGTSGMKSALNGGLQLSVLDGWWAEGYDGTNGWAISGDVASDPGVQDAADAAALYDLLEHQILPLFADRDAHGIPRSWVRWVRASMRSLVPRFIAARMVSEYRANVYQPGLRRASRG